MSGEKPVDGGGAMKLSYLEEKGGKKTERGTRNLMNHSGSLMSLSDSHTSMKTNKQADSNNNYKASTTPTITL